MPNLIKMLLLVTALMLTACGPKHPPAKILSHQGYSDVMAYLQSYQPKVYANGQQLTLDEFFDKLKSLRVIYVGEQHDRYDHHLNQLLILSRLHSLVPEQALGLEWFQRPFQPLLDDYIAGRIDSAELLARSEYMTRWGFDFRMLEPILEYARREHIPVLALNADVALTKKVGQGGLKSLTPEERARLPKNITPPSEQERTILKKVFDQHQGHHEQSFENFLLVQRIWDLTMAGRIVDYLQNHPKAQVIVFAGSGHLVKGRAIPAEVAKQLPGIPSAVIKSSDKPGRSDTADYLMVSPAAMLPPTGKLGIWFDEHEKGALVRSVVENSGAAEAGIQSGDVITEIDGQPIVHSADLRIALLHHQPGDTVKLTVLRHSAEGKETLQNIEVRLKGL